MGLLWYITLVSFAVTPVGEKEKPTRGSLLLFRRLSLPRRLPVPTTVEYFPDTHLFHPILKKALQHSKDGGILTPKGCVEP
jgi:hypothetical protein